MPFVCSTIIGFVGRKQTEDMLKQCLRGTFLLRFSDSELGGVTIAWVGGDQLTQMLPNIVPMTLVFVFIVSHQ